jgi:hypothetical protein
VQASERSCGALTLIQQGVTKRLGRDGGIIAMSHCPDICSCGPGGQAEQSGSTRALSPSVAAVAGWAAARDLGLTPRIYRGESAGNAGGIGREPRDRQISRHPSP